LIDAREFTDIQAGTWVSRYSSGN